MVSDPGPVALERFAELRAEIDAGEPLDGVIDREAISPEKWAAAQAHWLKQMADEAEAKRFETTTRYQTLYRIKKKLLDAERARKKRLEARVEPVELPMGPLVAAENELAARPASVVPAMALAVPPIVAKPVASPSFLEQPPRAPLPPARVSTPAPFGAVQPPMAQPVAPPGFVQAPATVAPPLVARPMGEGAAITSPPDSASPVTLAPNTMPVPQRESSPKTMSVDIHQLLASAVPFAQGQGMPGPAALAPTEPPKAPPKPPDEPQVRNPKLMSTMMVDIDELKAKVMPFGLSGTQPIREEDRPKMTSATPFAPSPKPSRLEALGASTSGQLPPPAVQASTHGPTGGPAAVSPPAAKASSSSQQIPQQMPPQMPPQMVQPQLQPQPQTQPAPRMQQPHPPFQPQAPNQAPAARGSSPGHAASQGQSLPYPPPQQQRVDLSRTMAPLEDDDDDSPRTMMIAEGSESKVGSPARPLPFGSTTQTDSASPATRRDSPSSPQAALPFARPQPAPTAPPPSTNAKIFSINQFASLTAEIAEHPEKVEEIRRKYGVTEAQHHAESQRWTEEFAMSTELRQRYFGIVSRYREYLKKKV